MTLSVTWTRWGWPCALRSRRGVTRRAGRRRHRPRRGRRSGPERDWPTGRSTRARAAPARAVASSPGCPRSSRTTSTWPACPRWTAPMPGRRGPRPADGDFAPYLPGHRTGRPGQDPTLRVRFQRLAPSIPRLGAVRNPWNTDHTAGASSSGSGRLRGRRSWCPSRTPTTAVSSIRIPAACNGLVGLKPSRGRLPAGQADASDAVAHRRQRRASTRSVRDTAAFYREAELLWRNPEMPAIGDVRPVPVTGLSPSLVTRNRLPARPSPEIREATCKTAALLEGLGHRVTRDRQPDSAGASSTTSCCTGRCWPSPWCAVGRSPSAPASTATNSTISPWAWNNWPPVTCTGCR